ncbi:hypothetical protein ACFL20_00105 [Spirochaetota bacterium]
MKKKISYEISFMGKLLVMFPFLFCLMIFLLRITRINGDNRNYSYIFGAVIGYLIISSLTSFSIYILIKRRGRGKKV